MLCEVLSKEAGSEDVALVLRTVVICQHFSGQTIKLLFGSPHRPLGPGCH